MADRHDQKWGLAVLATLAMAAIAFVVAEAMPAGADGPTTFSSSTSIAVPAAGSANQIGPANPYPSTITVSGMSGLVTDVDVTLSNVTHGSLGDVDALLVAPTGANLIVLSDVGGTTTLATASNATYVFDDGASGVIPSAAPPAKPSGTYRPTNDTGADTFPAPAPTPSTQTTLAGAFSGINPNGTWSLYVVDDATGDTGSIAGGWSLTVTTESAAVATTTVVTSSTNPSTTGTSVTFTATVAAGATPVTSGTVQFAVDGTNVGSAVAVNASGQATLTTSALAEGTHLIRATYSGASGFLTSNGTMSQRVDNATTVNGNTFCNTGALTVSQVGAATPYPSHITVSGITGPITEVTVALNGVSHSAPIDFDVLLAAPSGTNNLVLMSDAGGQNPVSNVNLVFDDDAAGGVPAPMVSGTFKPTDDDSGGGSDVFPAPAPAVSSATTLSTFDGVTANGVWSLYVNDDATGDAGSIAGGWCLTVTATAPTSTALTSSVNPSTVGESVTFTATVTAGGNPVTTGTVAFDDGGTPLGGPITVAADGTATLTTSALTAGTHTITASYSGTASFATSSDSVSQVVSTASTALIVTSSVNPSTVGDAVTFTATVTTSSGPVTQGTVTFDDGGTPLALVTLATDGTATLTTSALTEGTHPITATYSGAPGVAPSSGSVTQVVGALPPPVAASAGGPYTVVEGESLTLDASASTPGATYEWDLDGDTEFDDASGIAPTLTWAQLEALGIDDGPAALQLGLRVTLNTESATATAALTVTNTAPDVVLTGGTTATVGQAFTVKVGADDPSSADMAGTFTYTADWGDGSPVDTVTGPSDPPMTHTYATAGTFTAFFTATDKDGSTSVPGPEGGLRITVELGGSTPTTPTTPTVPPDPGTTPTTTAPSSTTTTPTTTTLPGGATTSVGQANGAPPGAGSGAASGASPASGASADGTLPVTGANTARMFAVVALLSASGVALVVVAGTRRRSAHRS